MINIKKILITVLVVLFPFSAIGCWDRTEVSDLAIVIGIGIDRGSGSEPISLTVQIVNPSGMKKGKGGGGGGGEQSPILVKTSQGKSLYDAIQNLSKDIPRRMYFAHNVAVILGKDYAKTDVADPFDYMERDKDFRRTNFILVADKTAKEILNAKMDLETLPAESLKTLLRHNTYIYPTNRNEFLLGMRHSGVSFTPVIKIADEGRIHIDNMAIFQRYRLLGFLTENESKDLLWLINKQKEDSVVIASKTKKKRGIDNRYL